MDPADEPVGDCSRGMQCSLGSDMGGDVLRRRQIPRGAQSPQRLRALSVARFFHFKGRRTETQRGRVLDDGPEEQTRSQAAAT